MVCLFKCMEISGGEFSEKVDAPVTMFFRKFLKLQTGNNFKNLRLEKKLSVNSLTPC